MSDDKRTSEPTPIGRCPTCVPINGSHDPKCERAARTNEAAVEPSEKDLQWADFLLAMPTAAMSADSRRRAVAFYLGQIRDESRVDKVPADDPCHHGYERANCGPCETEELIRQRDALEAKVAELEARTDYVPATAQHECQTAIAEATNAGWNAAIRAALSEFEVVIDEDPKHLAQNRFSRARVEALLDDACSAKATFEEKP